MVVSTSTEYLYIRTLLIISYIISYHIEGYSSKYNLIKGYSQPEYGRNHRYGIFPFLPLFFLFSTQDVFVQPPHLPHNHGIRWSGDFCIIVAHLLSLRFISTSSPLHLRSISARHHTSSLLISTLSR